MFRFIIFVVGLLPFSFSSMADEKSTIRVAAYQDDIVSTVIFDGFKENKSINVEYKYYSNFNDVLQAVKRGEADFAANVTFTEERAHVFDFSSPTNTEFTYFFSYYDVDFKSAKRIGVPKSTVFGRLVEDYSTNNLSSKSKIDIIEYASHQEAVKLIEENAVDGIVDSINLLTPMASIGLEAKLLNNLISINPVSLITSKGKNYQLLKEIESYIHEPQVQKKLRESIDQYQKNIRIEMLRNELEQSGIDLISPITFKVESVGEFAGKDSTGRVVGLTPRIVTQLCETLRLDCRLSIDETPWSEIYQSFYNGEMDAVSPIVPTSERAESFLFTHSYYDAETVLVKRKGYKDFTYKHPSELIIERIGVISDDYYHGAMKKLLPNKKLYLFTHRKDMVDALINGRIDYIPMSKAGFHMLLTNSDYLQELVIDQYIGVISIVPTAIGLTKTDRHEALLPYFNRILNMSDVDGIVEQFFPEPDWQSVLKAKRQFSNVIYILSAIFVVICILALLHFNRLSNTDTLTGLSNRRSLYSRFRLGIPEGYIVIYFDIDGFKLINDTYGHVTGDNILKKFARDLKISGIKYCYRIGGDEFVAIGKLDYEQLVKLTESLGSISIDVGSEKIQLTVSAGISHCTKEVTDIDALLHTADINMYEYKNSR